MEKQQLCKKNIYNIYQTLALRISTHLQMPITVYKLQPVHLKRCLPTHTYITRLQNFNIYYYKQNPTLLKQLSFFFFLKKGILHTLQTPKSNIIGKSQLTARHLKSYKPGLYQHVNLTLTKSDVHSIFFPRLQ